MVAGREKRQRRARRLVKEGTYLIESTTLLKPNIDLIIHTTATVQATITRESI